MKTYVLMIAKTFPKSKWKTEKKTNFPWKIAQGDKKHTVRLNFKLWQKRFEEINKGDAMLSLRVWEGLPYKSPQFEILKLYHTNGIGLQKMIVDDEKKAIVDDVPIALSEIAKNDGLEFCDFLKWFSEIEKGQELALIQFTGFRYKF